MTKENLTAVLIDDLELARISLRADIEDNCPHVDIIGEADGVLSGAKLLKAADPDIVFLDIDMQDGNGFDLLDILPEKKAHIIFVTGKTEHALKAFQYSAVDYLLKPVDTDLLVKAVDKVQEKAPLSETNVELLKSNISSPTRLALHTTEQILVAETSDIIRLESMGNYTQFYFADGSKELITKTLKIYDAMLDEKTFVRVHQSHLVNVNHIKSYIKTEGGYLLMKDGSRVPVSVRKKGYVMELLGQL